MCYFLINNIFCTQLKQLQLNWISHCTNNICVLLLISYDIHAFLSILQIRIYLKYFQPINNFTQVLLTMTHFATVWDKICLILPEKHFSPFMCGIIWTWLWETTQFIHSHTNAIPISRFSWIKPCIQHG